MRKKSDELIELLEEATEAAFRALLAVKEEKFYYFGLLMDEGMRPFISAWSYEALHSAVEELIASGDDTDREVLTKELKWSGCDSPYCAYEHDEYFESIDSLLENREQYLISDEKFEKEFELRLKYMEEVMRRLDAKGVFESSLDRSSVVITAEVLPPDYTNTERVKRLNPKSSIEEWVELCAEPEE